MNDMKDETLRLQHKPKFVNRKVVKEQERCLLLEQIYVHDVYERMASDFQKQQYQPWPVVTEFLMNLDVGSLVADVGCGNGHYMGINPSISLIGLDRCSQLLELAQQLSSGFACRGDCLSLPFRDNSFDAILCVGVIHHLVSFERQAKALKEMSRILHPGGTMLLCAWAWEQPKRKFEGQNLLVPRHSDTSKDNHACRSHTCCVQSKKCDHHQLSQNDSTDSLISKLLGGPKSILRRFSMSRESRNSDSGMSDTSSVSSIQSVDSDDWIICDESRCSDDFIEIPEEFQVREFPASSLFAVTKPASAKSVKENAETTYQRKQCRNHLTSQLKTRDERFYYVFKEGELSNLIQTHVPNLIIDKCSYNSGHWCVNLVKKS